MKILSKSLKMSRIICFYLVLDTHNTSMSSPDNELDTFSIFLIQKVLINTVTNSTFYSGGSVAMNTRLFHKLLIRINEAIGTSLSPIP